jgi:hypothetical protein
MDDIFDPPSRGELYMTLAFLGAALGVGFLLRAMGGVI